MLQRMRSGAFTIIVWVIVAFVFVIGFLMLDTSGLLSGTPRVTQSTTVASVNGRDILYQDYMTRVQNAQQQQQQKLGRSLTQDEQKQVEDQVFNDMVTDILLQQEERRRGITVTADEIREYAQYAPPQWVMQSDQLKTNGQFDMQKYLRYLQSPAAKENGFLAALEAEYRDEIPKQKLFDEVASAVYVSDAELWRAYQDDHDSAQVSYVALRPESVPDNAVSVSDDEIQQYYDAHKKDFERPGRAVLSLVEIPRVVSPADSAAVRAHAIALRNQILNGARFEDVAKSESADSASAVNGGYLGRGDMRGKFVPEFEKAVYSLKPGEISQPVLTQYGYHLIRVDERKGDTVAVRHILLRITQSDSSATITDRKADSLAKAANATSPALFDSVAHTLHLPVEHLVVFEGEPGTLNGRYIPSVSAWAFGGPKVGETSDLFDSDAGYFLARLDSLYPGGEPSLAKVKDDIRHTLLTQKKIQKLVPQAQQIAQAAAANGLDAAAKQANLPVATTPMFTRGSYVPGLGQLDEAIGAAFGLPVGAVSAPVTTKTGVYVIRVDKRVQADRAAFEKQKDAMRQQVLQGLRRQRVQQFVENLRKAAKIEDNRKKIDAAQRATQA